MIALVLSTLQVGARPTQPAWRADKLALSSAPPYGPLIYQPYIGARIYSAILESTLVGGKKGLSFFGVGSLSSRSGPSNLAVAAAFPFFKVENVKTAGWAYGFGYGQSTFSYEQDRYVAPSLRFFEMMVGRTSVEGRNNDRSGFGGYFEITLRDEQLNTNDDYEQIAQAYGRTIAEHNRSFNIRIGAVSEVGGLGFVTQKPSPRIGHSYHLGLSLPMIDKQSTTIHLQAKIFTYCRADDILCGLNVELHHARNPRHLANLDDLENQLFIGPWMQFHFGPKYLLSFSSYFTLSASANRTVSSWIPLLKSSFTIAF